MSEFIGSRISLISKSDIRYVGVLHDINSENSSVALENVKSYGTEGRKQNPEEEIPASDNVYEYIVFRGSDVKDLRVEAAAPKENRPPPQIPNDPAILGAGSRPQTQQQGFSHNQQNQQFRQPQQQFPPPPGGYPPPFQQNPRFAPPGGPHGFPGAPGGIPSYPGFNGPPGGFGGQPGWYNPPGQGFPPNQGPFSSQGPPGIPIGAPVQQQQDQRTHQQSPIGAIGQKDQRQNSQSPAKPTAPQAPDVQSANAAPGIPPPQGPPPPVDSKPDTASALAPPSTTPSAAQPNATKTAPTVPKGKGGIIPVVPLANPNAAIKPTTPASSAQSTTQPPTQTATNAALNYQNATQAATAAVAAAMAKLPPAPGQPVATAAAGAKPAGPNTGAKPADGDAIQHLAKKVSEMRTDAHARQSRQPGTGGFAARGRGRGRGRGGAHDGNVVGRGGGGIEVPAGDYDFETANKRFNKQDLVKEAIATGSPLGTPDENGSGGVAGGEGANGTAVDGSAEGVQENGKKKEGDVIIPPAASMYNKASSFFDDISSDLKDREDVKVVNGREMRSEERKKNMETFGQGSVDSGGYRGGFRGRGRGRGGYRGGRGYRGGGYRGRGGGGATGAQNGTVIGTGT